MISEYISPQVIKCLMEDARAAGGRTFRPPAFFERCSTVADNFLFSPGTWITPSSSLPPSKYLANKILPSAVAQMVLSVPDILIQTWLWEWTQCTCSSLYLQCYFLQDQTICQPLGYFCIFDLFYCEHTQETYATRQLMLKCRWYQS